MEFVGQEKLINTLNSYTLDSLPKTMMFLGESGCGKHTLAQTLAEKLGLTILKISRL